MLGRTLEPEVMDSVAEAVDYDAMDHSAVNRVFVDDLLAAGLTAAPDAPPAGDFPRVLDVGTGTAQIPIELCRRQSEVHVVAVDLAVEMLRIAGRNVTAASLQSRISLERVDAKRLNFADRSFDAVISNSIVHHIADPGPVLGEMLRVLRPEGRLFVRDLLRPSSADEVERLVAAYAGNENSHQRQMFRDSLHAALTLGEIRAILDGLGCPPEWVAQTSDRHWTISSRM